jgi:hypothetical protein
MAITNSVAHARIEDDRAFYCKGANAADEEGRLAAMLCVTEEDEAREQKWFQTLFTFRAGLKVVQHMANVIGYVTSMAVSSGHQECPIEQSHDFRNVLVRRLAQQERPYGLPSELPNFIVMANMSGERALYYSEEAAAIMFFAQSPLPTRDRVQGVRSVIAYARRRKLCVVCCCSWPFHRGPDGYYWNVFTLTRVPRGDGSYEVRDGQQAFDALANHPHPVSPTVDSFHGQDMGIIDTMCEAYSQHVSATSLDGVEITHPDGADGQTESKREAFYKQQCEMLAASRKEEMKQVAELKKANQQLQKKHTKEIEDLKRAHATENAKLVDNAENAKACAEATAKAEEKKNKLKQDQIDGHVGRIADLEARIKGMEMEAVEAAGKAGKERDSAKQSAQDLRAQLTAARKVDGSLRQENEALKVRLESEVAALREAAASDKRALEAQLAEETATRKASQELIERQANEKEAVEAECALWKTRSRVYRALCHAAALRHHELRIEHDNQGTLMQHALEEAATASATVALAADAPKLPAQPAVSVACSATQTEILPESLQIGELTAEVVKLQDEAVAHAERERGWEVHRLALDEAKHKAFEQAAEAKLQAEKLTLQLEGESHRADAAERARDLATSRAASRSPNGAPNGAPSGAPGTLDSAPMHKDPSLEAIILQDHTNRTALCEAARMAVHFRQLAERGWSSYHGLHAAMVAAGFPNSPQSPMPAPVPMQLPMAQMAPMAPMGPMGPMGPTQLPSPSDGGNVLAHMPASMVSAPAPALAAAPVTGNGVVANGSPAHAAPPQMSNRQMRRAGRGQGHGQGQGQGQGQGHGYGQ